MTFKYCIISLSNYRRVNCTLNYSCLELRNILHYLYALAEEYIGGEADRSKLPVNSPRIGVRNEATNYRINDPGIDSLLYGWTMWPRLIYLLPIVVLFKPLFRNISNTIHISFLISMVGAAAQFSTILNLDHYLFVEKSEDGILSIITLFRTASVK